MMWRHPMIENAIARTSVAFFILVLAGCDTHNVTDPADINPAVATSLLANPGWSAFAIAGTAVAIPPSVTVKDQRGAGIAGVTVTFSVSTGGGSVTGASVVTSPSGTATVGAWVLGPSFGPNVLTASVNGLSEVTFQSTATQNFAACVAEILDTHLVGTITNGTLASTDCYSDGSYSDRFAVRVDSAGAYSFTQSAAFETYLSLTFPDGRYIADNLSFAANPTMKVLLAAGSYILNASSSVFDQTGPYSLSSEKTSADVSGCERVYTTRLITTIQSVQSTDCTLANGGGYGDAFTLYLGKGLTFNVSMTSDTIDSYLELYYVDLTGARILVGSNDDDTYSGRKDALLTYTPANNGFFVIVARAGVAGQTGSYTLNIQ